MRGSQRSTSNALDARTLAGRENRVLPYRARSRVSQIVIGGYSYQTCLRGGDGLLAYSEHDDDSARGGGGIGWGGGGMEDGEW